MNHGVVIVNPKFRANVGMILRLCAGFDVQYLFWTGDRAKPEISPKGKIRLPREERLEEYKNVLCHNVTEYEALHLTAEIFGLTPVAVDCNTTFEPLPSFVHPERAVYVFGSEDTGLPSRIVRACHRFVNIPVEIPLNLATAVAITLYDRKVKGDEYFK